MSDGRFTLAIGGEAGFGIMAAGLLVAKLASRSGYSVCDYTEYPSVIRGGHNVLFLTIGEEKVFSTETGVDILVALTEETVKRHVQSITRKGVLLYDSTRIKNLPEIPNHIESIGLPCAEIAKSVGGTILMKNTVALGALVALTGGSLDLLFTLLEEEFGDKKPEIVLKNKAVAKAGFEALLSAAKQCVTSRLQILSKTPTQLVITGNEAIALGALQAGVQFVAIYPMTPTSNVLHTLAAVAEEQGLVCIQPEDEISGINMAIGASYAGVRSMVATSGGGFCLMTEAYGLAGITETPLVIIEGMRGAPATGLPTWTEQGDLRFILHAHQGDFPRIVLAAGDAEEAQRMTAQAFYLADKYQTPVVLLVDKHVCEGHVTMFPQKKNTEYLSRGKFVDRSEKNYKRYALTPDHVSPRSIPGVGNCVVANSDEHDESGYSNEEISMREAQMEKRMGKLVRVALEDMEAPSVYGAKDAELTIVSWGSNKGAILEAMKQLPHVNYVHVTWMSPFPKDALTTLIRKAPQVLIVENNYSGQLTGLIAEQTGIRISHQLLGYSGRPFFPEDIIAAVKKQLAM